MGTSVVNRDNLAMEINVESLAQAVHGLSPGFQGTWSQNIEDILLRGFGVRG